ncbi:MAG: ATP-binding cassette domain-containing protein [Bacteroidetes bacterium]|nr:ATP-binding cassette domain-containing protein [Bacteroidota bacterium]MCK4406230.1 ATP-binding cassette domain-containing protein [Bacteroidales bacterium]
MDLFSAHNITKHFSNHTALNKVSISVSEQSIFGLLGPNGAGKTTFLRIINQITAPDEGELFFSGKKLTPKHIEQIGYLPEERGLYKKMKVGEQALYLAQLKGINKKDAIKKLKYWFEKFEILTWWNRKVEELSKGMQQKVQFIITILHEPKLLIFDEPFSGFDPINVNLIKDEILKLRDNGSTIIFSTHNMASVEELCDHIALIDNSIKILDGKVKDIKKEYKSNTYEVVYTDFIGNLNSILDNNFKLLEQNQEDDLYKAKIKLPDETRPNDLLQNLMPHLVINSFNEIIPTMNDIFIAKVKKNIDAKYNNA